MCEFLSWFCGLFFNSLNIIIWKKGLKGSICHWHGVSKLILSHCFQMWSYGFQIRYHISRKNVLNYSFFFSFLFCFSFFFFLLHWDVHLWIYSRSDGIYLSHTSGLWSESQLRFLRWKCTYPCWWWSLLLANSRHVFPFLGHENILRNLGSTRVSSKLTSLCWKGRIALRVATRLSNQRLGTARVRPLIGQGAGNCDVPAARALSPSVAGTFVRWWFYGSSSSVPAERVKLSRKKGFLDCVSDI